MLPSTNNLTQSIFKLMIENISGYVLTRRQCWAEWLWRSPGLPLPSLLPLLVLASSRTPQHQSGETVAPATGQSHWACYNPIDEIQNHFYPTISPASQGDCLSHTDISSDD